MTQTNEQRLLDAKKKLQEAEKKRIQIDTRLENVQSKKKDMLEKCKQLNVKPEDLPQLIAQYDKEIEADMKILEAVFASSSDEPSLPY